jgi:KipI family sensor histidine kinase inhibitor
MITWYELAEDVIIFKVNTSSAHAELIRHQLPNVMDAIVTDNELAVQHNAEDIQGLVAQINPLLDGKLKRRSVKEFEVPICYDLGLDWEEVERQVGLGRKKIEQMHQSVGYQVSYGFSPGFLYLGGLPTKLHCKRKDIPRLQVPKGSVGIGGEKTGIYSLETPGGWQIIGRTPMPLFDVNADVPVSISDGAIVRFESISQAEFLSYEGS